MPAPGFLTALQRWCHDNGAVFIADEIQSGIARTGAWFACDHEGVVPDVVTTAKGLAGGTPLSAVTGSAEIMDSAEPGALGGTYCGNPLACAAALATLDIFEEDKVIEANRALSTHMARATAHLADHPHVAEVRQTGMVLAIEMVQDKASRTPYPWQERRGLKVFQHGLERGALLRPLGSVVYFLPPYVITPEQIDFLAEVASEGIDIATRDAVSVAVSDFHPDHRDPG